MTGSVWDLLGVDESADPLDLRRAYARKLKVTNPEDDPDGFKALREAYELALGHAERAAWLKAHDIEPASDTEAAAESLSETGDEDEASGVRLPPVDTASPVSAEEIALGRIDLGAREGANAAAASAKPEAVDLRRPDGLDNLWSVHKAACDALADLVAAPRPDDIAIKAALTDLLRSPALDSIELHDRTEYWLAMLIHEGGRGAHGLVEPAIDYFRWDDNRLGVRMAVGDLALNKRRQLKAFKQYAHPGSAHNPAYRALSKKPTGRRWVINRIRPGLPDAVEHLLKTVRRDHPGMEACFDRDALAWWDDYFSRTRLGPLTVWGAIAGGLIAAAMLPVPALLFLLAWGCLTAGFIGLVLFRLYGFEWPRAQWRARWGQRAPAWIRLGWAPCAAALVAIGVLAPVSASFTAGLAAAGLLIAVWARIVGDFDRRELRPEDHRRFSDSERVRRSFVATETVVNWRVRAVLALAPLLLLWGVVFELDYRVWIQGVTTSLCAGVAWVAGAQTLGEAWRALPKHGRAAGRFGLAAMLAITAATIGLSAAGVQVQALSLGLATLLLLFRLPLDYVLDETGSPARNMANNSWPIWGLAAVFLLPRASEIPMEAWVEAWIVAAVCMTLVGSFARSATSVDEALSPGPQAP